MYDRERELWKQSGARYRVKEEKRAGRKGDTFESDRIKRNGRPLPIHLASLENTYGNIEFTRQEDGSLAVSFAKKQEFKEPVFEHDEEKINESRLVKERTGSLIRMHNSGSPWGAEAFVLSKGKSASRQVNRIMQEAAKPLEQMARSMASLLVPASQDVMPREQFDMIYEDLVRTARRSVLKSGEKTEEEEKMKKDGGLVRRLIKKNVDGSDDGNDGGDRSEENGGEGGKDEENGSEGAGTEERRGEEDGSEESRNKESR